MITAMTLSVMEGWETKGKELKSKKFKANRGKTRAPDSVHFFSYQKV